MTNRQAYWLAFTVAFVALCFAAHPFERFVDSAWWNRIGSGIVFAILADLWAAYLTDDDE